MQLFQILADGKDMDEVMKETQPLWTRMVAPVQKVEVAPAPVAKRKSRYIIKLYYVCHDHIILQ